MEEQRIYPDLEALSRAAAERLAALATAAISERGRFLLALAGGSTPRRLYHLLAEPPYRDQIAWLQVHLFWGDERCVPPDDPGSNYGAAAADLIGRVTIPPQNVHRIKGELAPEAAAAEYTAQLAGWGAGDRAWPRFDLALLGMGSDGHTASLFPGKLAAQMGQQPVMAVSADYQGRPAGRVTLTPPPFNSARHIFFLVSGAGKARALAAVRHGPHDPDQWPAQRIRPSAGQLTWLVDEAAAHSDRK